MIENTIFPYKTALSEADLRTNGMGSRKWTYHKGRIFSWTYHIFLENLFYFKNLLWRVDLECQLTTCPYSNFLQALEFHLRVLLPCEHPWPPHGTISWKNTNCVNYFTVMLNHSPCFWWSRCRIVHLSIELQILQWNILCLLSFFREYCLIFLPYLKISIFP